MLHLFTSFVSAASRASFLTALLVLIAPCITHAQTSDVVTLSVTIGADDSDDDGIPDDWEEDQFEDLATASPGSDFDSDGMTDFDEYWAGTDPKSANSFLAIMDVEFTPPNDVRVVWSSSTNLVPSLRSYDILCGNSVEELSTGGTLIANGVPSEGMETDIEDDGVSGVRKFYRVRLHR